ncbi:MAG: CPBP family intramembrane metalloprotease [Spirochaetaceae bacterium]|nr:MAG: CPBP family intramembrane metalloprotease [Spirochaetaceae bacterium]
MFYLPGYLWPQQELLQGSESLRSYMLQFMLVALPQILLLLYILRIRAERDAPVLSTYYSEFGIHRPRAIDLLYGGLIFAGIFALLALLGLILTLLPAAGRELFAAGFRWKLEDPRLIPLVLLFCLVTGYREELFFRSYLITRFRHLQLPVAVGIGLSTLLFAAGHVYQGIAGLAVALIQGLYFSILFVRMHNLHPLAIAHGLYNSAVLIITLFVDYDQLAAL